MSLPAEALDVWMSRGDFEGTLRDYFKEIAILVWTEEAMFSGKRPFGNSDWQNDVYASLIDAGLLDGMIDEYGCVSQIQDDAERLVTELLVEYL